jgi:SMODS and SLOG-associating 2TM effector domain 2
MGESAESRDIKVMCLANLDWSAQGGLEALHKTANYACAFATQAADWYLRSKKWKRIGARWLRFAAIFFVAAAGILPMIQQLATDKQGMSWIPPVWASILLAIAVFLVALDRFFGFSAGWIRYVLAEAQIRRLRQEFEIDWQALLASYKGQPPTSEQVQHALATAKAFVAQVNTIIGDETLKWVAEFQEALKEVDEQVRAAPSAVQSGSLAVTVTNGDMIDAPGWTLAIDQAEARTYTGKTAAIVGLMPGDHALHLLGKAGNRTLRAEAIASIRAGTSTAVEATLA